MDTLEAGFRVDGLYVPLKQEVTACKEEGDTANRDDDAKQGALLLGA